MRHDDLATVEARLLGDVDIVHSAERHLRVDEHVPAFDLVRVDIVDSAERHLRLPGLGLAVLVIQAVDIVDSAERLLRHVVHSDLEVVRLRSILSIQPKGI